MDCDYAVVAVILLLTQQYKYFFQIHHGFRVWGLEHFSAAWSIANVTIIV